MSPRRMPVYEWISGGHGNWDERRTVGRRRVPLGARVDRSATPIRSTDAAHGRLTASRSLVVCPQLVASSPVVVCFTRREKKKNETSFARRLRGHFARLPAGLHITSGPLRCPVSVTPASEDPCARQGVLVCPSSGRFQLLKQSIPSSPPGRRRTPSDLVLRYLPLFYPFTPFVFRSTLS